MITLVFALLAIPGLGSIRFSPHKIKPPTTNSYGVLITYYPVFIPTLSNFLACIPSHFSLCLSGPKCIWFKILSSCLVHLSVLSALVVNFSGKLNLFLPRYVLAF